MAPETPPTTRTGRTQFLLLLSCVVGVVSVLVTLTYGSVPGVVRFAFAAIMVMLVLMCLALIGLAQVLGERRSSD